MFQKLTFKRFFLRIARGHGQLLVSYMAAINITGALASVFEFQFQYTQSHIYAYLIFSFFKSNSHIHLLSIKGKI